MSRSSKSIIGLLSFFPLIIAAVSIILVINLIPQFIEWDNHMPDHQTVLSTLCTLIIAALISCLISLGLLIYFLIHMLNNKKLDSGEKVVWILAFLFVGVVGYPVYWYMRIWNEEI